MAFPKKALAGGALLSLLALPAFAVVVNPASSVNSPEKQASVNLSVAGVPVPTPRPELTADNSVEVQRNANGIRLVGPRFFPDH
ncbi:hypothetical protein [Consotaella salsifontis]|uniref:Uncharacterized protein n=1 Tax=Consotaella salsifontis TaxID=1365950 RepID=A0A1T4NQ04_9HYPH|nr:hypothetical protein [Consotaella salsifontis]SJZ81136.1 hypothetical protein SAMN05428963_103120 [Consotaella salsifontis]